MGRQPRWNIVETHMIETSKDAVTHDKYVNNYLLLRTLGEGRFGKVKLCERIPSPPTHHQNVHVASDNSSSNNSLDPPPPPLTFASAAVAPPPPPPARRQFAVKIFSKKMLRKMKEYCSTDGPSSHSSSSSSNGAVATARMRVVTALDNVRSEIEIMRTLYHRNIVLLFEVMEAEHYDKLYLVMEYMEHGPCMIFHPETKRFTSPIAGGVVSEDLAKSYTRDILNGLHYLHQRGICHRDLKPANVLLNGSGRCHITDFGCAMVCDLKKPTFVTNTVGTYQFLAPECCTGDPYDPFKVDIWAVGIMLYIFLVGKLPFESESTKELFDEIARTEQVELPSINEEDDHSRQVVSDSCCGLLRKLLTKDPERRITITEALQHPWLIEELEEDKPLSF